ncbi:hypothetical protein [Salisediminibacterium selenitireducens]|uniref:Uncharacterized protein n=1 Tax=Bacillus selenitireducens (strain ATCC 700615 / DSM 15326 / MLS10) TaxID=439292 RepID=D6XSD3_BACIE|nr:hypothetical protein [Salisediminibacterium selenitireducens]ADH98719.1 hypothetical protein Bsel_1206 [[Bacillus] selenitireducens MLS10]
MIGVEIALFTAVVIVWGLPFALKIRQAVAGQVSIKAENETARENNDVPHNGAVEKVELVYVPVLIFFFTQDMTGAMIMAILGFLIHAGYMMKLSPLNNVRFTYTPEVQRLTGTVYAAGGLVMMVSVVLAAFWTIAAGLVLMIVTIWSVHPLVRTVHNGLAPVEEHVRNTAVQDAVRLLSVSEGTELILIEGIEETGLFEDALRIRKSDSRLFPLKGERLTVYDIASQINSGPVAEGEWVPVYLERLGDAEQNQLMKELKPGWWVQVKDGRLLMHANKHGKWERVLEETIEEADPRGFIADQLIRMV